MRAKADVGVLAALFFVSGISGLIYQSLWMRLLSLVFGVTIYAASAVLTSFMAGLALGAVIGGWLARRVRSPLRWFGGIELGIGAAALLTAPALNFLTHTWTGLQGLLTGHLWALTIARFVCSFAVLIVPTLLMGATLPLVVRSSLRDRELVGPRAGLLYTANTTGAITGALLAGFVLIGTVGIQRSFYVAAALNAIVGLLALVLATRNSATPALSSPSSLPPIPPPTARATERVVLLAFALSGFAALALEVIWFRVLVLVVAATSYEFTTMLAAVLLGIAAGSALATPLLRRSWNWIRAFGTAQIATGFVTVAAMSLYFDGYAAGWFRGSDHVASLFVIVPAATAMGFAFPMGIRAATGLQHTGDGDAGARVARLYAANVGGGIAGAAVSGFLLLPAFGSRVSLIFLALLCVLSGLLLQRCAATKKRRTSLTPAVMTLMVFGALAARTPNPFVAVQGRRIPPDERPLFLEEGRQTTVGVYGRATGGRVLYLDGLHQANDSAETVHVHRQIGLLPAALHPAPTRALVIGLGGGVTSGALSQIDGLTLDVVELSDSVVRAAEWFSHVNHNVLFRPNVRLRVGDGRNYLLTTPERYDIITADIIQPIHAGAGNLYSVEYFRLAKRALAPGGVMLQWIGARPISHYKLIARTFLDAFPNATVWVRGTLLVGTVEPLRLDAEAFQRKSDQVATRHALTQVGLASFDALLSQYTAGPEQLRAFLGSGRILSDDLPLVEYHRSLPRHEPIVDTSALHGDPDRWVVR